MILESFEMNNQSEIHLYNLHGINEYLELSARQRQYIVCVVYDSNLIYYQKYSAL